MKIRRFPLLMFILTLTAFSGCTTTGDGLPTTKVITDTKGIDMAQYNQDMYECRQFASQISVGEETLTGLLAGAIVGAAVGAAIDDSDTAKRGASLGAISGASEGAGGALSEQDQVIKKCLVGRGYQVLN